MKKHELIFLSTALFVFLFYNESLGLNIGLLGIFISCITWYRTSEKNKTRKLLFLLVLSWLSSFAFMWYADLASFAALTLTLLLLNLKSKTRNLNGLFVIPVTVTNGFTFLCRLFKANQWLPQFRSGQLLQKVLAFILIPMFFLIVFFAIYTHGSTSFEFFLSDFKLNIDFWLIVGLSILGFFLSFNYWNPAIEKYYYKNNSKLNDDFETKSTHQLPDESVLSLEFQRISGVISLIVLNILLSIFIFSFSKEQFFDQENTHGNLSFETHERVNAVIFSIIMAIGVIIVYFKSYFNFDGKARTLRVLAIVWLLLNGVLIFIAAFKNLDYVLEYSFTYKRLGVFVFLLLSLLGIFWSIVKIKEKKTTAFLFNKMAKMFYSALILSSVFNWGNMMTKYNLNQKQIDINYLEYGFNFNELTLLEYSQETQNHDLEKRILSKINHKKEDRFLSKNLFTEWLNFKIKTDQK